MFKAVVLACHLSNPDNCTQLSDTNYIHETFQECALRAEVIRDQLSSVLTGFVGVGWKCVKKPNQKGVEL